jgi:hypothetical protein
MLLVFLDIEIKNKECINLSYDEIMQKVRRSSEKEKEGIIKYLGDMSIEERRVENMFKNFKLGRWNVGEQKGLVEYDKDTYDRERDDLLRQLDGEGDEEAWYGAQDSVAKDATELQQEEEAEYDREEEGPLIDENLDEDYNDGVYYEEDRDDEDGFGYDS